MSILTPLITPQSLKEHLPLSKTHLASITQLRRTVNHITQGEDERFVIFVGPCSIHRTDIALEYAKHLHALSTEVSDRVFLVMRVFLEKPRTQFGWKGFLYDPNLDGSDHIEAGLLKSRELLLQLTAMDIPIATEFLDPILPVYIQDLITWGVIGARTSSSQVHRQAASSLPMPVGFKNETEGHLDQAICAALASRHPQLSLTVNDYGQLCAVKTAGNPLTHIILRGTSHTPNYDPVSVAEAIQKQRLHGLNSRLVIDCAHDNSQKNPVKQQEVFMSVLDQVQSGNPLIMGAMLESHLQGGNALSITDPCLDWETTQRLILLAYERLPHKLKHTSVS